MQRSRLVQIAEQEPGADAGGFENDGQPAARMGAAADKIHAVRFLKTIARAQVEHLFEAMGEIERRAAIDVQFVFPVRRGDNALEANAPFDISEAKFFELAQGDLAVGGAFTIPI